MTVQEKSAVRDLERERHRHVWAMGERYSWSRVTIVSTLKFLNLGVLDADNVADMCANGIIVNSGGKYALTARIFDEIGEEFLTSAAEQRDECWGGKSVGTVGFDGILRVW